MRYWLGTCFLIVAAGFVGAAVRHRAAVLRARPQTRHGSEPESELAMFGEIMRPILLGALVYAGIKTSVAYWLFDGGSVLSLFDLGGFLVLLASYGVWLTMKTRHRMPADRPVRAPYETEAANQNAREDHDFARRSAA